jgi:uncharacterized protein (DUF779 family)
MILAMCTVFSVPVLAGEDYHDGDHQQNHVWIQEGGARFCYQNNGGWSTEDMLVGFHTIDGEVYYFSEVETAEWRYGQMVIGTIEVYGGAYTFNSEGHMVDCYGGLE